MFVRSLSYLDKWLLGKVKNGEALAGYTVRIYSETHTRINVQGDLGREDAGARILD